MGQRTHMMELEPIFLGKTYDDFLVRPQEGVVRSRRDIGLTARLTRQLTLALPVVSANMDSVTEAAMAKTLALEGGIGFIHRGMSIEGQAREVTQVKRSHGFVVEQPLCLAKGTTMRDARAFLRQHAITGLLIEETAGSNILAGVLSNRDIPWQEDAEDQPVEAFMTPFEELHTQAPGISGDEAARVLFAHRLEKLPLIDTSRRIHGLITKKDLILYRQRPHASTDAKGRLLVGAAIGVRGDYLERAAELVRAGADVILMDVAHGHSKVMQQAVESFRKRFEATALICGNVGTAEGACFLQALGVDGIKVGIGPGRGCRTRLETAAGVPQLQAIREAWCAVGEAVPLIADGGIKDTVVKPPGLPSPCTMKCGEGLLTAFSVGFTPHIQRKARTDLRLRPHPVDTLLHLAIAPIAPLHRIRGGGQQLVIEKREGLFQRGGKELLQGLPHLGDPLEPTPQCGEFGQSGLGPTAPIE